MEYLIYKSYLLFESTSFNGGTKFPGIGMELPGTQTKYGSYGLRLLIRDRGVKYL